jgi:hypothetical protein
LLTFGDFHPDAIDAVNLIFACADPLISLEALINNNAAQNAVAAEEDRNRRIDIILLYYRTNC